MRPVYALLLLLTACLPVDGQDAGAPEAGADGQLADGVADASIADGEPSDARRDTATPDSSQDAEIRDASRDLGPDAFPDASSDAGDDASPDASPGCATDEACGEGAFCERPGGTCDAPGPGACRVRPEGCPEHEQPVCGCDGQTYGNDCNRQMAGVSLDREGPCDAECQAPADCLERFWDIRCVGHWACEDFRCVETCDDVGCGDGNCEPEAGESPSSCFLDCRIECEAGAQRAFECPDGAEVPWCTCDAEGRWDCQPEPEAACRDTRCDDGTLPICPMAEPMCRAHEILAVQGGCFACVNPETCRPWGEAECASDADCPAAERCDACGSSSCPECEDCVPACVEHVCETEPEPACDLPRPECDALHVSVVVDGCWICVDVRDCGEAECTGEGEFAAVVPGAPPCCEGLEPIGCDAPVEGECSPDPCVGAVVCARCGDGACGPGENLCNCAEDCGRRACDEGPLVCAAEPPVCEEGSVLAVQGGCWVCVNPATCRPWGEPGCAADADCGNAELCDGCGSSSCPFCADCVPACRAHGCATEPEAACDEVRPNCGEGAVAVVREGCWRCVTVPACEEQNLRWYQTCGDPVCGGHRPTPGERACAEEMVGQACGVFADHCDPMDFCNARLLCTDSDPRLQPGGCPISELKHKRDVRYVDAAERSALAEALQGLRLASWRYVGRQDRQLGFVIEDGPPAQSLRGPDQVELYGYLSLAVAALQEQQAEIQHLRAAVEALQKARGGDHEAR